MFSIKLYKSLTFLLTTLFVLNGCNGKLPGADARKYPADPKKRIEQNIKEGKAFRLMDLNNNKSGGTFEFASSNELWRASLDVIDFMPLTSVNIVAVLLLQIGIQMNKIKTKV